MMTGIYRINSKREEVKGRALSAFIHNGLYHIVTIGVYEDGMIDCWGLCSFDEFVENVERGWVVTSLPEGATVSKHGLFYADSCVMHTFVEEKEFIKEVRDTLDAFQGKETSTSKCMAAYEEHRAFPNEGTTNALRIAYENTPKHVRQYLLGDMDNKDSAIKRVIQGESP